MEDSPQMADREINTKFDDDIDASEFNDLPSTDINVQHRLGFAMTGSFPLHVADLYFCDTGLYLLKYGNITPLLGLTTQKHRREAESMAAVYKYHGIDEAILQADFVTWLSYEFITQIIIHTGGRIGRPKLTIELADDSSESYRIHDPPIPQELSEDIAQVGLPVDLRSGYGLTLADLIDR